jgi:hypothetical protein
MANTNIVSIGMTGCEWFLSDLGSDWNSTNYVLAYITINGSTSSAVYPPPSGTSRSTSWGSFSGLSPNTWYTAYGYVLTPAAGTFPAGSQTFKTLGPPRPSNWFWWTSKDAGSQFSLAAAEWNSFTDRINAFRAYKSLPSYSFTSAISGDTFAYYLFNQAVSAISAMGVGTPGLVSSGSIITAAGLNGLMNSLNSVF